MRVMSYFRASSDKTLLFMPLTLRLTYTEHRTWHHSLRYIDVSEYRTTPGARWRLHSRKRHLIMQKHEH